MTSRRQRLSERFAEVLSALGTTISFTVAVCLVVLVSALLIRATLQILAPLTDSSTASLVGLVVFAAYVGIPSYLVATRTESTEEEESSATVDGDEIRAVDGEDPSRAVDGNEAPAPVDGECEQ